MANLFGAEHHQVGLLDSFMNRSIWAPESPAGVSHPKAVVQTVSWGTNTVKLAMSVSG